MARHPMKGSRRPPMPGAIAVGKPDPTARVEVSMVLRRPNAAAMAEWLRKFAERRVTGRQLSRAEFDRDFAASRADMDATRHWAAAHGLAITAESAPRRTMAMSGSVAQFNAAFDIQLERFDYPGGSYRGWIGTLSMPSELAEIVEAVLGLDDRPVAVPHFRPLPAGKSPEQATSFTPLQVAGLYNFPAGTGQGECVGIIELGGGEQMADLATYFSELGIDPAPTVTIVSVDGGQNQPTGDPDGPDGEVALDIEVVGALVPEANIAVYFAPNTDAGFMDSITTAIHDTTNQPSVISISYGGPESGWMPQALMAFDQALQDAVVLGVTICVASGDSGSSDGVDDGGDHVDFPASSPHVLACGGTSLSVSGNIITEESVWNDGAQGGAGGGGVSTVFALPSWQQGLQVTLTEGGTEQLAMRGVPDVAGDADPETGYQVRIDGMDTVIGGTSAVAPLYAALIARINAALGSPIGFINPTLYAAPDAFNDITIGDNGDFAASPGWDACTGLGSPDGTDIAALFMTGAASE
jgi:kumamolisin